VREIEPDGEIVWLRNDELRWGAITGIDRQLAILAKGGSGAGAYGGTDSRGWSENVDGAAAELAVAKLLGVPWSASVNTFNEEPDILPDIQVRYGSGPNYRLLVRQKDKDEERFVLVLPCVPLFCYNVKGWLYGAECKQAKWLKDVHNGRPPMYLPPRSALRPMAELIASRQAMAIKLA